MKVYCERCECSYNVPNNKNGDQWLNYHWRHFNCLQKKLIRQQEEDSSVVRKPRQPSHLKTDKSFIIDGMRQIPVERKEDDDLDSDEASVDSSTNFDMHAPVSHDDFDEETYEDYNESHLGFSAPPEIQCRRCRSKLLSIQKGARNVWNYTPRSHHEKRY